ncbi:MAG: ABC transporter substrate-binding protein [Nitrosopumilus sp.]|nr:ABC transporter substrate-binding protein [Nitrosopumilus sp.]
MKSRRLLSVVFSLIMFTGVTAGNAAFADSDELDDILEGFCVMTTDEQNAIISENGLDEYAEKFATICAIEDEDDRENSLEDVIDAISLETNVEDENTEDFEDCVEADGVIGDNPDECTIGDMVFVNDEDDDDDEIEDEDRYGLDDRLENFCNMTDEEKRQLFADHPRLEQFSERLAHFCSLNEDERQDALEIFVDEHKDEFRKYHEEDMREKLAKYCEMSDEDRAAFVAEHDKAEDHVDDMNQYCELDENGRIDFIAEHQDEYKAHMKDQMMDKKYHMDYEKLCALDESERAVEIDDAEKLAKISEWCEMTPEERDDYKKESHDSDKSHDFDNMSDVAKERMSQVAKDKHEELREKFSEQSERIKSMIMDKRDISDERHDEIKMKYEEKFGEDSDKKRTEIKMKYKDHMLEMKFEMSEERKSDVHDRVAEMKAYKAELREQSSQITDEEKQQLREEFIEQAKDMQLAWISPRTQMTAGIDATEVECREGFSLVMKVSNGVAMCLKADSALKMIDRGIIVPAN